MQKGSGKENVFDLSTELKNVMFSDVGIYRNEKDMQSALEKVREIKSRFNEIRVSDTGKIFNTDVLETFELGCLLDLAEVTATAALNRTETRGGHAREDYDKRDDVNWLNHSMAFRADGKSDVGITYCDVKFEKKPVVITKYQPKERKY